MVDVQRGTTALPFLIQPRINGVIRTQKEIKEVFSNVYVDDNTTPLTWTLEYTSRNQPTPQTILFNEGKSTNETIAFDIPNSFYADYNIWVIMIRWNIVGLLLTEQIYTNEAIQVEIKDLQLGL